MKINNIVWKENTIYHIARHGVEPIEVEEVCFGNVPFILGAKHNRYFALGQTKNDRYLTIVFEYLGQNKAKIITARAMSESERRIFRKRR